jgi:hypothetical protein
VHGKSVQARGVVGESTGSNASASFGRNDLGNGVGVDGYSQAGLAMRATSSSGTGLRVESFSGGGIDVSNNSTSKPAFKAYSLGKPAVDALSAVDAAVRAGSAHAGVVGLSFGPSKPSEPEAGCGVFGTSLAGAGACGITLVGTGVLGVGYPQLNAWAGRFVGNVHVDGILFKSASLFSIDHPLDPTRKVLNHAASSRPSTRPSTTASVTLDRRGQADGQSCRAGSTRSTTSCATSSPRSAHPRPSCTLRARPRPARSPSPVARRGSASAGKSRGSPRCLGQGAPDAGRADACQGRSPAAAVTLADTKRVAALAEKTAKALHATEKARRKTGSRARGPAPGNGQGPAPGDAERTERMARDLLREIGRLPRMPDS